MLSFPLIARELRVQARKRSTYDARLAWGLAVVAALGFITWNFPSIAGNGRHLLSVMHFCLALMLVFLSPIGASDAISREKREGTLGLLMLTELTGAQVVLGKLAAHSLRLIYAGLLMLPFIIMPVLVGGVEFQDFLLSLVILFSITAAGVGAGLIASALLLNAGPALFTAAVLASALAVSWGAAVVTASFLLFPGFRGQMSWVFQSWGLGSGLLLFPIIARDNAAVFFSGGRVFWFIEASLTSLSAAFLFFAVKFAARRVERYKESSAESQRAQRFRRTFLTPVLWRDAFRRWLARKLDRNPFIWLEYRTAWARAARWAMVLAAISAETMLVVTVPNQNEFIGMHFLMLGLLAAFMTFKSSSSFQREKESGAFELLLVTPFTETEIVNGRLRAVMSYYGLTVLTLILFGLLGFASTRSAFDELRFSPLVSFVSLFGSLLSIPVCGLYFALRCSTFMPALLWTAGIAVCAPLMCWSTFNGLLWMAAARSQLPWAIWLDGMVQDLWLGVLLIVAAYHLSIAAICKTATLNLLKRREFSRGAAHGMHLAR